MNLKNIKKVCIIYQSEIDILIYFSWIALIQEMST